LSCAPSCARCATKRQPRGWRPRRRGRHSQCSLRPPASIRPTSRWPRCGTDGLRRLHTSTAGRAAMLRPINALGGYWFDGALRALEGLRHGLASTVSDPPPVTHHRVVFESGKLRLRHYAAAGKPHRTPILFVYALIKRPFILDIQKGRSVIEYLTRAGFDVFVTDWQPPTAADSWRGFDAYVNGDLHAAVRAIRAFTRREQVTVLGYCFGGMLSLAYTA